MDLISLFNRISKDADKLWFATYKEIVAYNYNRINSTLKLVSSKGKTFIFELTTSYAYDGLISLSFENMKSAELTNGDYRNVYKTDNGNTYINIQPKSNSTIKIKITTH